MGDDNTALVLAAIDAWERRDKEGLLACFSPDFEFILSGQIPDQPLEIHGHDEYSRFFDTWLASWETFEFATVRIAAVDDARVLVKTTQRGLARDGMRVDRMVWFVAEIADSLITRYRTFVDEASALEAAGIAAWPLESDVAGGSHSSSSRASAK